VGGVRTFKEILAWQKGHHMVLDVYRITKKFPPDERLKNITTFLEIWKSVVACFMAG
jgi:hypothetical protein